MERRGRSWASCTFVEIEPRVKIASARDTEEGGGRKRERKKRDRSGMVFPRSRTSAMGTWRHFVAPLRPRPTAVMMRPLRFSPQSSKIGRGGSLSPPSASAREAVHLLWYLSQTCSICRSHIAIVTHPIRVYLMCFFFIAGFTVLRLLL